MQVLPKAVWTIDVELRRERPVARIVEIFLHASIVAVLSVAVILWLFAAVEVLLKRLLGVGQAEWLVGKVNKQHQCLRGAGVRKECGHFLDVLSLARRALLLKRLLRSGEEAVSWLLLHQSELRGLALIAVVGKLACCRELAVVVDVGNKVSGVGLYEQHAVERAVPVDVFVAVEHNREARAVGLSHDNGCRVGFHRPCQGCSQAYSQQ